MTSLTYTTCPICQYDTLNPYLQVTDHSISKETFPLVQCASCQFLFTQNVPQEANAGPYYQSEDYISHSDTAKGLINKVYHAVRNLMLRKKRRIIARYAPGKKVLDVGCGTGYFLNHLKQNNYHTTGVEISEDAKKVAQEKFGLNVHAPSDLTNGKLDKDYDAITLWHVLEHLYDLNGFMQTFHQSLSTNGVLVIAVPNHKSLDASYYRDKWSAYDVPRHLWHFSPETIRKLATKHQFEIVRYKRLPFDPFYNCMLSEKYNANGMPFIFGMLVGFASYLNSIVNIQRSSSIIYVLKKK
jgi:2-polyprenyl-3-methyl-5-hydroxy-6-metoxy-1,4-benzoquinol methylase